MNIYTLEYIVIESIEETRLKLRKGEIRSYEIFDPSGEFEFQEMGSHSSLYHRLAIKFRDKQFVAYVKESVEFDPEENTKTMQVDFRGVDILELRTLAIDLNSIVEEYFNLYLGLIIKKERLLNEGLFVKHHFLF